MADRYYASKDNQQSGPVAADQLAALFQAGEISRESLVWREGLDNWLPLRRLFDELGLQEAAPATPAARRPSRRLFTPRLRHRSCQARRACSPACCAALPG